MAFASSMLMMVVNHMILIFLSAKARNQDGVVAAPEDTSLPGSSEAYSQLNGDSNEPDQPNVKRVHAVHHNFTENVGPWLCASVAYLTGAFYAQGSMNMGVVLFYLYPSLRLAYTVAYLRAAQPWRSIFFGLSFFTMLTTAISAVVHIHKNYPE